MFQLSFKKTSARHSEQDLFNNIEKVWAYIGRQPRCSDMSTHPSVVHFGTYFNRFGSWKNALLEFSKYKNGGALKEVKETSKKEKSISVNNSTKYEIMKRDNFKCVLCGRSPANETDVILEVDHIVPRSKNGLSLLSNLQTLCKKCNSGKSNKC